MSTALRVLLVTDAFPPVCGGSGWSTFELARGLTMRGHHVEVVKVDVGSGSLPREVRLASTHALSVGEALELGRALGRAPRRVVLLGVEGAAFAMGDPLTPSVEAALEEVVAEALGELR